MDHSGAQVIVFDRVIGGEPALAPQDALLWDGQHDDAAIKAICARYAGPTHSALWLGSGRAALGVALRLIGGDADRGVAAPAYQCAALFAKISGRRPLRTYPLGMDLLPDMTALRAIPAGVILTTLYFGSPGLQAGLVDMAEALWRLPGRPWIIEDRVLCVPEPGPFALARDFILYSFRKAYPVPDGALLIAVSDRARALMPDPIQGAAISPGVRMKIAAKVARWHWLHNPPIHDDLGANALTACMDSEKAIDRAADDDALDMDCGSVGSARWLLRRDPVTDLVVTGQAAMAVMAAARHRFGSSCLGLPDAIGPGVPILSAARGIIRRKAAARGIFMPIHWPRDPGLAASDVADLWYANELTFPTGPMHSPDEWMAVSAFLSTLDL